MFWGETTRDEWIKSNLPISCNPEMKMVLEMAMRQAYNQGYKHAEEHARQREINKKYDDYDL